VNVRSERRKIDHKGRKVWHLPLEDNRDGSKIDYYPNWLSFKRSQALFETLKNLPFEQKEIIIPTGKVFQPRLTSWHGDPGKSYTYSGLTVNPEPWTEELLELKKELTEFLGVEFNSVLANYYRDGSDSIGKHSDNEEGLGPEPDNIVIASITFNGQRDFHLNHRTNGRGHSIFLECGSLLVMSGTTQRHWTHEISKTKRIVPGRINLTFRVIVK